MPQSADERFDLPGGGFLNLFLLQALGDFFFDISIGQGFLGLFVATGCVTAPA